jgi:3-oxoacyl-[acyl-carrier-protein] synthase II
MHSSRRVVVTGLGTVSPVGNDVDTAWKNVVEGNSGIATLHSYEGSSFSPLPFAGLVKDFDPAAYIPAKEIKKMDPFIHYAVAASTQAIRDCGISVSETNTHRIGVAVGSGIGGIGGIEKTTEAYLTGGPRKISPFFVPSTIANMASGQVAIMFGLRGPNIAVVTACTTGTHCIGISARMIAYGDADVMICGGAEHATTPTAIGGFMAARALSAYRGNPQEASRPWDQDRDGFVLSDGAGVLVLEEFEHAKARGAKIYAELIGFGMSDDAFHMTAPPEDGSGAANAMKNAVADAKINVSEIGYLNAHATSTPLGDIGEIRAIKSVLGDRAKKALISSTKSVTGHLLGAAGGVEAIYAVLSLRDQVVPPTINLHSPSPECDLDLVPHTARQAKLDVVMSNSFGFGGTNGTLIFKRTS